MMQALLPTIYIFSPERSELSARENEARVAEVRDVLQTLQGADLSGAKATAYLEGIGQYEGKAETSFLVKDAGIAMELSEAFEQDCILVRYGDGSSYLRWTVGGNETYLGQWREVSSRPNGDHSSFEGRYFVVGK
jgi:hypothetical protein